MTETTKCASCGGAMQEGFIMDRAHYNFPAEQQWVEGEAQHSFWTGLKTDGRQQFKVETYRCEKCGRLESYARKSAS